MGVLITESTVQSEKLPHVCRVLTKLGFGSKEPKNKKPSGIWDHLSSSRLQAAALCLSGMGVEPGHGTVKLGPDSETESFIAGRINALLLGRKRKMCLWCFKAAAPPHILTSTHPSGFWGLACVQRPLQNCPQFDKNEALDSRLSPRHSPVIITTPTPLLQVSSSFTVLSWNLFIFIFILSFSRKNAPSVYRQHLSLHREPANTSYTPWEIK